MTRIEIEQVRRFNRTVAEGIGALDDRFLGRSRPFGQARLLWEIGPPGADIDALGERLGLTSAAVSRLLRPLERQRLVAVRSRRARLTKSGLAEWHQLDHRSDRVAEQILEPLSASQRGAFLAAVGEIERLLHASLVRFAIEDPRTPTARWCIAEYFNELNARFDAGFDPSRSISADAAELTPPSGALVIARLRGEPIGCGAVKLDKLHHAAPAELKRMWVAPQARSLGIGRRLLHALETYAREAGARSVRLETNRALREAIALYRRSGYVEVPPFNEEPYAHHWFEKQFTGA